MKVINQHLSWASHRQGSAPYPVSARAIAARLSLSPVAEPSPRVCQLAGSPARRHVDSSPPPACGVDRRGPSPVDRARPESPRDLCQRLLKAARWCVLAALERQDPAKTLVVFAVSVAETPSHETLGASRTDLRVMDNRIRPREPTLHDALACSPESLRSLCRLYAHRRAHRRATIFRTEGLPKTSYPGAIIPDCG